MDDIPAWMALWAVLPSDYPGVISVNLGRDILNAFLLGLLTGVAVLGGLVLFATRGSQRRRAGCAPERIVTFDGATSKFIEFGSFQKSMRMKGEDPEEDSRWLSEEEANRRQYGKTDGT